MRQGRGETGWPLHPWQPWCGRKTQSWSWTPPPAWGLWTVGETAHSLSDNGNSFHFCSTIYHQLGEHTALYKINNNIYINPFTAPACKKFVLKDAWMHLHTVYFPLLWCAMGFDENTKKKTEAIRGLKFYTFIGCFQVTSWQWWG